MRNDLLAAIVSALNGSVTNMNNRNKLLVDIVLAAGGVVTNPNDRNQLLQDWLDASGGVTPEPDVFYRNMFTETSTATMSESMTLIGDFFIEFDIVSPIQNQTKVLLGSDDGDSFIALGTDMVMAMKSGGGSNINFANVPLTIDKVSSVRIERTGNQGTITVDDVSQTQTVDTADYIIDKVMNGIGRFAIGGLFNLNINDIGKWLLTNLLPSSGKDLIGSNDIITSELSRINLDIEPTVSFTTATLADEFVLPDASQAVGPFGGFTCTGMTRLADGRWCISNFGKGINSDIEYKPSLVMMNDDFSQILDEIDLSPAGLVGNSGIQGVTQDASGNIWVCSADFGEIVGVTLAGALVDRFDFADCNGLSYDNDNDALYVNSFSAANFYLVSLYDYSIIRSGVIGLIGDQNQYIADKATLVVTYGDNGVDGSLQILDMTSPKPWDTAANIPLAGAIAIEGVYIEGNDLYIGNDVGFHPSGLSNRSTILKYTLS